MTDGGCSLECLNVCENPASFPPDSVAPGEVCEFDRDCSGAATCDNDIVNGAGCLCVSPPTCTTDLEVAFWSPLLLSACTAGQFVNDVGGNVGDWNLKRTCRRVDGSCSQREDEIGLGHHPTDNTDLCWEDDNDGGNLFSGVLCGSDYNFVEVPLAGEYETGVFHFSTEVDFEADWILYDAPGGDIVARCKGKGKAEDRGEPDDPPDCDDYRPFDPPISGPYFDGTFIERFNCVQNGVCVDQDESSIITLTLTSTANKYELSSDNGMYRGTAIRSGSDLHFVATFIDPADSSHDYSETGTYSFSDDDNFEITSSYKFIGNGSQGSCTGRARRGATPPAPDPFPPCP